MTVTQTEEPIRTIMQLYNLVRGHALRVGRNLLGLATAGLIIYPLFIFPANVETKNLVYEESSLVKTNTTMISTKLPNVSESYLIGLITLVLLSPIIITAKAGIFEFTLAETERSVQPLS